LLQRGADNLKVAKDTLVIQDGLVTSRAGSDKLSYAQLIGEQKLAMKIDPAAPLKDPKDYTIVGTSVPRRDIPAKIFGTFNFVQDHKLPGMLQATYDFAMQTHGSIGPSCAVADFKDGRLTVWTPSQASHLLQVQLATMLSLKPENVRCIFVEGAGCYGRNGADDCTSEAAVIA